MKKLEATCESVRVVVVKRNNKSPLVTFLSSFFLCVESSKSNYIQNTHKY